MLGIAIFSILLGAAAIALLQGQESTINGGDRTRAAAMTERTLEGARAVRDESFSALGAGQFGVRIAPSDGTWEFSGTETTLTGGYVTSVTVSSLGSDWKKISAHTKWKHGYNRSGSVLLLSEFTDWKAVRSVGNWATLTNDWTFTESAGSFNAAAVGGTTLFVGSDTAGGGDGLYLFDLATDPPTRIATSFSLPSSVRDLMVRGDMLYLVTSDSSAEIKGYDISTPSLIGSVTPKTYDLAGSARANALDIDGTTLLVTATLSGTAGEHEVYTFSVASTGAITLTSSLNDSGGGEDIALTGTAAYVANTRDDSELRLARITGTSAVVFPTDGSPAGGYNLSDSSNDGLSIALTGTYALLGRSRGTSISEMVVLTVKKGGLPTTPGPYYYESSGSVLSLDADPSGCYGFLATEQKWRALQVVNVRNTSLPLVSSYTLSSGQGRGVFYDAVRDQAYLMTDDDIRRFEPAAPPSACP
jgi:hypothetical protein